MDNLAILIPCYNESQTITKVVKDCQNAIKEIQRCMYMTITLLITPLN